MSLIKNLHKDYGDFKINIPRWEISDQGITALHGPSGAGKTSCFRLLIGLEPCPGLVWKFGEKNIAKLPVGQRRLGVVFQDLELFPHMSARENILFAARARKIDDPLKKLDDLTIKLSLSQCIDRSVLLLSGGEQQRVALARALIGQPQFLFLDEPFSSLDANLRNGARNLVKDIILEFKIPTLLITHDEEDLKVLADQVVYIKEGELQN